MRADRSRTLASLLSRGTKTPVEVFTECAERVADEAALMPQADTFPELWNADKHADIESLRVIQDIEQLRSMATTFGATFAMWRNHVTDQETLRAARLQGIVGVLQKLYKLRHDPDVADVAGELTDRLITRLERNWGIKPEDVPINSPYREWCSQKTRDYQRLPKAWRFV